MVSKKTIAVLHEARSEDMTSEEQDMLVQLASVEATLRKLGYESMPIPVTLDLSQLKTTLHMVQPFMVFNLVKSLEGNTSYLHFIPSVLADTGLAFTGSGAFTLFLTTDKLLSKKWMQQMGVTTPDWQELSYDSSNSLTITVPFIIKPVRENTSRDITDSSVIYSEELYYDLYDRFWRACGSAYFIEAYIEGREINVSLLSNSGQPEVLPPSEIRFNACPDSKSHIENYNAKWCPESFEYNRTPRSFVFKSTDQPLLKRLKKIACQCWKCFGMRGYARVDFRVDRDNRPWVININANPCLSPGSGFIAAAQTAGYTYEGIITRILDEAYFQSLCCRTNKVY